GGVWRLWLVSHHLPFFFGGGIGLLPPVFGRFLGSPLGFGRGGISSPQIFKQAKMTRRTTPITNAPAAPQFKLSVHLPRGDLSNFVVELSNQCSRLRVRSCGTRAESAIGSARTHPTLRRSRPC